MIMVLKPVHINVLMSGHRSLEIWIVSIKESDP